MPMELERNNVGNKTRTHVESENGLDEEKGRWVRYLVVEDSELSHRGPEDLFSVPLLFYLLE